MTLDQIALEAGLGDSLTIVLLYVRFFLSLYELFRSHLHKDLCECSAKQNRMISPSLCHRREGRPGNGERAMAANETDNTNPNINRFLRMDMGSNRIRFRPR